MGTSTEVMGLEIAGLGGAKVEEKDEESLSTKGIWERRVGMAIVEEETGVGIGIGAEEGLVGWLNSIAMVTIVYWDEEVVDGGKVEG